MWVHQLDFSISMDWFTTFSFLVDTILKETMIQLNLYKSDINSLHNKWELYLAGYQLKLFNFEISKKRAFATYICGIPLLKECVHSLRHGHCNNICGNHICKILHAFYVVKMTIMNSCMTFFHIVTRFFVWYLVMCSWVENKTVWVCKMQMIS